MQIMEPDVNLHTVVDLSSSRAAINDVLDSVEEDFSWLNEILLECKNTFTTATVNLLPKTPSQKKPTRKRARRRLTEESELEIIAESDADSQHGCSASTSDTPVRKLRSTRSRTAQSSTSSRVTRNSKPANSKSDETNGSVSGLEETGAKAVKLKLPSVDEVSEQAITPSKSVTVSSSSNCHDEGDRSLVRERTRAYETMLSERNKGSPGTPSSVGKGTPKSTEKGTPNNVKSGSEKENAGVEVAISEPQEPDEATTADMAPKLRRSSQINRRSSAAGKRISMKVLGSKARLKSLEGRLSVTGPCASFVKRFALESKRILEDKNKLTAELELQNTEVSEVKGGKLAAPKTRLRLKKKDKSAVESSESSSIDESNAESDVEDKSSEAASVTHNEKSQPSQASTRTKRKKQKSLSSDEESSKNKMVTDIVSVSNSEEPVRSTRTKTRKLEAALSVKDIQKDGCDQQPIEVKSNNCCASESQVKTTRTKTRKAGKANVSSVDTASSGEAMDTDGTEASVFESPTAVKKQKKSTERLSNQRTSSSTVDSGTCPTATSSVVDAVQELAFPQNSAAHVSDSVVCETENNSDNKVQKSVDSSRRQTHVINRESMETSEQKQEIIESMEISEQKQVVESMETSEQDEEVRCTRSTRTKTRKEQNKNNNNSVSAPAEEQEDHHITRTKTRKRKAEEEAADTSVSKKSCVDSPSKDVDPMDENIGHTVENDSDYEDIDDQLQMKTVPSLLNKIRNSSFSRSTSMVSGVVTSFLKKKTPPRKPNFQVMQEQKKKELLQKEKREQERLSRLDIVRKNKAEEQKKKREERMRKVAEMREMRQKKELDLKKNLAEKLMERLNSTDRMKEDKFKEDREKQKLRLRRQLEADERRRQEEDQRMRKLLEQQEEQKRYDDLMQRKKEQEEMERQRRIVEERKRHEERQAEAERQRLAEKERLRLQELEREKERQKEKEEKERIAAQERAERARLDLEKKKERELKIQKDLDKLKEMEQQRLAKMAAQEEVKRREQAQLQQVIDHHNRNLQNLGVTSSFTLTVNPATTAPSKVQPNPDSYPISPVRKKKKSSLENYDIADLKSDDSTDEDDAPRKKIPSWAQGASLKALLINQAYHPPDLDAIFSYIEPPDLNEMFERKRARFNKRTSSAVWTSPMHKPL